MAEFEVERATDVITSWIRKWFENNGNGCNAIVGVSGGKDSTVVAALCVKALGKDRVIGVLMPNNIQSDIEDSKQLCKFLGIKNYIINIGDTVNTLKDAICNNADGKLSTQTIINLPARIRMTTLYAISQSNNGRVANTCNMSEDYIGYSTKYGDAAGDFSPLANYTVDEVKKIGRYLGIPLNLVDKIPSDGLCGKSDEDNLGFTYAVLDKYIRTGMCENDDIKEMIDTRHKANLFKLMPMESCPYYI